MVALTYHVPHVHGSKACMVRSSHMIYSSKRRFEFESGDLSTSAQTTRLNLAQRSLAPQCSPPVVNAPETRVPAELHT